MRYARHIDANFGATGSNDVFAVRTKLETRYAATGRPEETRPPTSPICGTFIPFIFTRQGFTRPTVFSNASIMYSVALQIERAGAMATHP